MARSYSRWYYVTMRRALVAILTAVVALMVATAVLAADPTKEKIARTRAGNAEAAKLVLKKRDLPDLWSGGSVKPDLSSGPTCPKYKPKQSDLVVIGAAETDWTSGANNLFSQTQVLRTPKMVSLDWKRTVADRRVLPCLRASFAKHAAKMGEKLVSLRWIAVPRLAAYTKAYRLRLTVVSQPAVVIAVDALLFGSGRDEVSLIASGPDNEELTSRKLQLRLARRLATRLH